MADVSAEVTGVAPGALAGVSSHTSRVSAGNIARNVPEVIAAAVEGCGAGMRTTLPAGLAPASCTRGHDRPAGPLPPYPGHCVVVCSGRMATAMRSAESGGGPWGMP
jgi:hypothetical protein